ncbi:hypothetical protein HDU90_003426, partial [Geranomyces variabilis]
TITNAYALNVASGNSNLAGTLNVGGNITTGQSVILNDAGGAGNGYLRIISATGSNYIESGITSASGTVGVAVNPSASSGGALNVAGDIVLGATTPRIYFSGAGAGVGAPSFTSRTAGTKLVIFPRISSTNVDYAIGIDASTLWTSVPANTATFLWKWYGGTTNVMTLDGTGNLTVNTPIVVNRLPSIVEVLGDGYPLFSNVPYILTLDKITEAHQYLQTLDNTKIHIRIIGCRTWSFWPVIWEETHSPAAVFASAVHFPGLLGLNWDEFLALPEYEQLNPYQTALVIAFHKRDNVPSTDAELAPVVTKFLGESTSTDLTSKRESETEHDDQLLEMVKLLQEVKRDMEELKGQLAEVIRKLDQ